MDGFENGFRLGYGGVAQNIVGKNSIKALENPHITRGLIMAEVEAGRIQGPFSSPPFDLMHISPLSIRVKSTKGKYHLLHNLSFPYDINSVNGAIPQADKMVQYSSIQDAVQHILALGRRCYMAKCDIKSAFRLIPISSLDFHLLGMEFDGQYFYDTTMPMGCASSCCIFERFSKAIHWIATEVFGCKPLVQYLDDYLLLAPSRDEVLHNLPILQLVCDRLGVPLAAE